MVQMHQNIVGLDASILMHPTTWKASGHVDAFNDPLIDNKDSKKRYRADVLIEDYCAKIEGKINKEVAKASKRFGDAFNKEEFLSTNGRVVGYQEKIKTILSRMGASLEKEDLKDVKALIEELEISNSIVLELKFLLKAISINVSSNFFSTTLINFSLNFLFFCWLSKALLKCSRVFLPVSFSMTVFAPYWNPACKTFPVVATVIPGPNRAVVCRQPFKKIREKIIKNIFKNFIKLVN